MTLSTLHATVHLGAHADGPNHYGDGAPSIDERAIDYYLGKCQIIAADVKKNERVGMHQIAEPIREERVLISTNTFEPSHNLDTGFAALEPSLVESFAEQGVKLIGIDTPSVDLFDSKDLPSHKAFLKNDMAILEGLDLRGVPAGTYELIALPLKLVGFDGSPVRAILRSF